MLASLRGGSPDGEWQAYIQENAIEFAYWAKAIDALFEKEDPIELTLPDGKTRKLGYDEDPAETIGLMLRDILIQARKDKLFASLPLAKKCSMGVEDHDGAYGWPAYEKRYTVGRVV